MKIGKVFRISILVLTLISLLSFPGNKFLRGQILDDPNVDQMVKMEQKRKEEEFQKLKDLAEQLQQKSGELRTMIDNSNRHTVSLSLAKKIDEIEKVLREIKNKTKPS